MFITDKELIFDFENEESRLLHIRADRAFYKVLITYIPFVPVSNFVSPINEAATPIQFLILSLPFFSETQILYGHVYNFDERIDHNVLKTVQIECSRIVTPNDAYNYYNILPLRVDESNFHLKNLKTFDVYHESKRK